MLAYPQCQISTAQEVNAVCDQLSPRVLHLGFFLGYPTLLSPELVGIALGMLDEQVKAIFCFARGYRF